MFAYPEFCVISFSGLVLKIVSLAGNFTRPLSETSKSTRWPSFQGCAISFRMGPLRSVEDLRWRIAILNDVEMK